MYIRRDGHRYSNRFRFDLDRLDLDIVGERMYSKDIGTRKIEKANLDGSNVRNLLSGFANPVAITLEE